MIIADPKKAAGVIVAKMKSNGEEEHEDAPEASGDEMLHGIAEDLIHAVKMGSVGAVASALKAAFNCLESQEHDEGGEGY